MKIIIFTFLFLFNFTAFSKEKLAMIDTGINLIQVDQNKIYHSPFLKCAYNFNIEDKSSCLTKDIVPEGHGTLVFQILANKIPNDSILSYIYASPDKSLKKIYAKTYPSSLKDVYEKKQLLKQSSEYIADAISLAISNQASVINISLANRGLYSEKLESAIKDNPSVLFIFAAGNDSEDMDIDYKKTYPCALKFKNTLCIGSLHKNSIAEYSNFGKDVDLFVHPHLDQGTSFSAPVIANEAYRLKIKNKSIEEIVSILKKKYSR